MGVGVGVGVDVGVDVSVAVAVMVGVRVAKKLIVAGRLQAMPPTMKVSRNKRSHEFGRRTGAS